ncbi:MAG: hypothetical protein WBC44_11935 [Planctomycetaceae bacterium]
MFLRRRWQAMTLITAALVIGLAYLFGGFLPQHELYLAPVGVAGIGVAFWHGLRGSQAAKPFVRLRPALMWAAAFLMILALPASVRWLQLRWEMRSIPLPDDAVNIRREANVVLWDNPPYTVGYVTRLSAEEVDQLLRKRFATGGWTYGTGARQPRASAKGWAGHMAEGLGRRPVDGALRSYTLTRSARMLSVSLFDAGTERWVYVRALDDHPPEALRKLPF